MNLLQQGFIFQTQVPEYTWPKLTAIATSVAAFGAILVAIIAFCVFVDGKRAEFFRYLADLYYRILDKGFKEPDFLDPKKTRNYLTQWKNNLKQQSRYDTYALMCWAHVEDIYETRFLKFFFKKYFRKMYTPTFERYKKLHGPWFQNNISLFLDPEIVDFVQFNRWRDYFPLRVADKLRWENAPDDYDQTFLHPFQEGVENPLFQYIENLPNCSSELAVDFGCGNGKLVEILSKKFKAVLGIDYSDNMLKMARHRCAARNVKYMRIDMTNMNELYGQVDYGFSVNSILPRDPKDTPKILGEIYKVLKPRGLFIAIVPSFDSVLYLKGLMLEQKTRELGDRKKSKKSIENEFKKRRRLDVKKCLYADDFSNVQRFIRDEEIQPLFAKIGFEILKTEKVLYPWDLCRKFNYGYFPNEEKKIWDQFVVAKKSADL